MVAALPFPDTASGVRSGQLIGGKFLLLEPLGAGGMGQVWTARNLTTSAEVAIKLLHTTSCTPDLVARFRREAYATGQLNHRGIVRVFDLIDVPEVDGSLAMVMERLRGRTLAELLTEAGPLTFEQTLNVVLPILGALHYAHHFGIIHRDLKPENVFLAIEPDGEVVPKLVDFGISKMLLDGNPPITGAGQIVGTPRYMSPEQVQGAPIDARSDVFCAGIVLYTCLTGKNPFAPDDSMRAVIAVLEKDPVCPPGMAPALWNVLRRALAKDPAARYASALDLAGALSTLREEARPRRASRRSESTATVTEVGALWSGSSRLAIGAGVALGIGIAACLGAIWLAVDDGARGAARSGENHADSTSAHAGFSATVRGK